MTSLLKVRKQKVIFIESLNVLGNIKNTGKGKFETSPCNLCKLYSISTVKSAPEGCFGDLIIITKRDIKMRQGQI